MRIPEQRLCDLCRNPIPAGTQFPSMSYPLDARDHDLIAPRPPAAPWSPLQLLAGRAPASYQFEFCRPCVDGLLPMLTDLKTDYIRQFLAERERLAAATDRSES